MIVIYCPRGSTSAVGMVAEIQKLSSTKGKVAVRVRKTASLASLKKGDLVVGWGNSIPSLPKGVRVLNQDPVKNKWEELAMLREAGVKTIPFSATKKPDWLPRRANHQGGTDLLHPPGPGKVDYYVQRVPADREFRVHVIAGKVVRLGEKVPRTDFLNPHPWIRSYDGGWRLTYQGSRGEIPNGIRELAKSAVAALGLDFGAVDVGVGKGGPWVFEVNKAPGLEGSSLLIYAKKFLELAAPSE